MKFFYLATCKTCQRILDELNPGPEVELREIKSEPITTKEIDEMHRLAGSYEALFTKRSRQYRARGLHEKTLSEKEMRNLILEEYTFLKRPVLVGDDDIFIGNAKATVAAAKEALHG